MTEKISSFEAALLALRPIGTPSGERLSAHSDLIVPHITVEFDAYVPTAEQELRWQDEKTWERETWRKTLVAGKDSGCPYGCGEVEIAARLQQFGFKSYWISEWAGFPHVACWEKFCVKRNELSKRAEEAFNLDQAVRAQATLQGMDLGRGGGHPDVIGLSSQGVVYVEYKGPDDSIRPKQNTWALAQASTFPDAVFLAVRGIIRGQPAVRRTLPQPSTKSRSKPKKSAPIASAATPKTSQREKLHRRTISDTLKREKNWIVESRVDGSIDFTPPSGVHIDKFAEQVREAVQDMGYDPTVRVTRASSGHQFVRVKTAETLAQAPRGEQQR